MEEKTIEMDVKEEKTENGTTNIVAQPKPTTKSKIREWKEKSWIWKNRGKIGAGLGAAAGFVGAMLLGSKNNDNGSEGPTE